MNVGGIVKMVSPTIYEFRGNKYSGEWRKIIMTVARNMKELEKVV